MNQLRRAFTWLGSHTVATPRSLPRWALAALIGNMVIIVTGAIVRLTASGLGCPTWPRCTNDSYVPHGAVTHHALIEFGNRLITFVLIFLALMTFWAAVRHGSAHARKLALVTGLGIPFQGVIGGVTVLTRLNPFVVAFHLLLSLVLVVLLTRLVMCTWPARTDQVDRRGRGLATATFVAMSLACWIGTVVTGSGPHSGDGGAKRTGLDIELVARVHSLTVWATVLLTIVTLVVLRRTGHRVAATWALLLLGTEVIQGAIGYAQYFTGLPIGLVMAHMAGAAVSISAAAGLLFAVRTLPPGLRQQSPLPDQSALATTS